MATWFAWDETHLASCHVDFSERGILIVGFSHTDIHIRAHESVPRCAGPYYGGHDDKDVACTYRRAEARDRVRDSAEYERSDHARHWPNDLVLVIVRDL